MKTKTKFLIALLSLITISMPTLLAANDDTDTDPVYVPATVRPTLEGQNPHRGLLSPFECYYTAGTLYVSSLEDIGEANVTLANLSGANTWTSTISGVDCVCIEMGNIKGQFCITIQTASQIYEGTFAVAE